MQRKLQVNASRSGGGGGQPQAIQQIEVFRTLQAVDKLDDRRVVGRNAGGYENLRDSAFRNQLLREAEAAGADSRFCGDGAQIGFNVRIATGAIEEGLAIEVVGVFAHARQRLPDGLSAVHVGLQELGIGGQALAVGDQVAAVLARSVPKIPNQADIEQENYG